MVEKRDRSTSDTAQTRRTGQTFDAFQAGDRRSGPESESKQLLEAQLRATLDVNPACNSRAREWTCLELRQILDLAPQLISVYGPGRERLYANRMMLDYLGIGLGEWLQRSPGTHTHPDDSERVKACWDRAWGSGSAYDVVLRVRKHDGSYRWFLARYNPVRDDKGQIMRWYVAGTDIEDRKQAEDRLRDENIALKRAEEKIREQEAGLRQMLDLTPQHVHVLTTDARLLYTNEIALKYHGSVLHDWQLRPLSDWRIDELPITLLHPDDRERVMCELKSTLSSGSRHETEARLLRNDGKYRWFLFRYNPLRDEQGRVVRWYVAGTDIEDHKQAEERLNHENVVLREEIDKASMFEEIVGTSPPLQAVLSRVSKVALTDSTVLITGETGTGRTRCPRDSPTVRAVVTGFCECKLRRHPARLDRF